MSTFICFDLNDVSETFRLRSTDTSVSQIDHEVLKQLEKSKRINWCRSAVPLFPLKTNEFCRGGDPVDVDRYSDLLQAVSTILWEPVDVKKVERLRNLIIITFTQNEWYLRDRWLQAYRQTNEIRANSDTDIEDLWQQVRSAFNGNGSSVAMTTLTSRNSAVDPIHIFALSNIMRRPIVVLKDDDCSVSVTGQRNYPSNDTHGIYLPVAHDSQTCCRSPVVLAPVNGALVPMTFVDSNREEKTASASHRLIEQEMSVPLVDFDHIQLPVRCLLAPHERPDEVMQRYLRMSVLPHTSSKTVRMIPVARIDSINSTVAQRDFVTQPMSRDAAVPTSASGTAWLHADNAEDNNLLNTRSYFTGQNAAYSTSTTQVAMGSPIICSEPECRRNLAANDELYCAEHQLARQRSVNVQTTSFQRNRSGQLSDSPAMKCIVDGCPMYGLPECCNLCSQHFKQCSENQFVHTCSIGPLPTTSLNFLNASFCRHGTASASEFCSECYSSGNVRMNRTLPAACESVTGDENIHLDRRQRRNSCIVDFCSNDGLAEHNGLCKDCYNAVYQARYLNSTQQTVRISQGTSGAKGHASKSSRCVMEGCRRKPVSGSPIDLCEICLNKQIQAMSGLAVDRKS